MTDLATVKNTRRTELAEFLRSRRERITPQDAGLPPGPRRRTPGLRREEVALLAGVGVTWYTWLEQGRSINASTQVLDAIARTLKLDVAEHQHLYVLAQVPEVHPAGPRTPALPDGVQAVLDGMGHMASAMSERFDILATNSRFKLVFPSMRVDDMRYGNTFWCTFNLPECCHPFVNRHQMIPQMVANLRAAYARHIGDPYWDEFVSYLMEHSEAFAEFWQQNDVAGFGPMERVFYQPMVGLMHYTSLSFGIHGSPGCRMQVYVPSDDATREAEQRLASEACEVPEVLPCGHTWEQWLGVKSSAVAV